MNPSRATSALPSPTRLATPHPAVRRAGLLVAALALGGCSGRQLTVRPDPPPGLATWAVVTVAAVGAAIVLGLVVTLTAWRDHRRCRWVALLLGAQTGALLVTAAGVAGAALRSRQLIQRSPDELPEVALLELSAIGNSDFADLILLGAVLFLLLPALVTGLTAHLATSAAPSERWMACVVLALQAGAGLLAVGFLITGERSVAAWLVALNGPVATYGIVACWPLRRPARPVATHPRPVHASVR